MPCKYFAPNGKPSKLFDSLYKVFIDRGMSEENAEKEAIRVWMMTRSENFTRWFGDWEGDAQLNRDILMQEAKKLAPQVKGIYADSFAKDIEGLP
jgi:hypothetical protein